MRAPAKSHLVDARKAGELAGVDPFTIWRWGKAGKLTRYRSGKGGRVWYDAREVRAMTQPQREQSRAEQRDGR